MGGAFALGAFRCYTANTQVRNECMRMDSGLDSEVLGITWTNQRRLQRWMDPGSFRRRRIIAGICRDPRKGAYTMSWRPSNCRQQAPTKPATCLLDVRNDRRDDDSLYADYHCFLDQSRRMSAVWVLHSCRNSLSGFHTSKPNTSLSMNYPAAPIKATNGTKCDEEKPIKGSRLAIPAVLADSRALAFLDQRAVNVAQEPAAHLALNPNMSLAETSSNPIVDVFGQSQPSDSPRSCGGERSEQAKM